MQLQRRQMFLGEPQTIYKMRSFSPVSQLPLHKAPDFMRQTGLPVSNLDQGVY
jgi:hypothetical protein